MSLEYPDFIDPQKAAEGHRTFSGTIALHRMERLKPFLASADGQATFTAQFDKDSLIGVKIQIEVDAALWLICQRSLEPYQEVVKRVSLLGVIDDISQEGVLPEGYEAILTEHGRISFLAMVEDELLLALPQVPRSPNLSADLSALETESGEYGLADELAGPKMGQEPRQHPFAGLADQLKEFASNKSPTGAGKK
ncbi:MAG: YceD family protein [Xanthomonadales bacterium]|nr:YceD family protein [Xanthomonadales bacterium]